MQTAINHAWRNTDIESLERYYTTYINPQKGVPTVMEFIYYYSSKIKKACKFIPMFISIGIFLQQKFINSS